MIKYDTLKLLALFNQPRQKKALKLTFPPTFGHEMYNENGVLQFTFCW